MLRLRVVELLEKHGKSQYSLYKIMGMSWQNYKRMITNETKSIRYTAIETMCIFFDCTPNELFHYNFNEPDEGRTADRR